VYYNSIPTVLTNKCTQMLHDTRPDQKFHWLRAAAG